MKYSISIISVLLFSIATAPAQVRDTAIDPGHFNKALLEHFIKIRIDSVRLGKSLGILQSDSLLYLAAQDQAVFLVKKPEIGHVQPGKKKKNPMDRAHYYHADYHMIGENVERIFYLTSMEMRKVSKKPVFIRTYDQAAREMVEGWVHSPPHYKNILTQEFDLTGVAVSVNSKDKSMTGVQVFGMAPEGFHPPKSHKFFPYE